MPEILSSSSTSASSQVPNILLEVFQEKLQPGIEKSFKSISVGDQTNLIMILVGLVVLYVFYFGYKYWSAKRDKSRTLNFLKISFLNENSPSPELGQQIYQILTAQHQLLQNQNLTFEIHKPIDGRVEYFFSCQNLAPLNYIESNLKTQNGLKLEISNTPPPYPTVISKSKKLPKYQLQLIPSLLYGNFRTDDFKFVSQSITQLNSLKNDEYGLVIISIRPVHKTNYFRGKITSLNYKASSRNKEMGGIDHNLANDVKELQTKNNALSFGAKIFVESSNKQVTDSISANFNLLTSQNYFLPKLSNVWLDELRFVPGENILMPLFQSNFGKYLNARELSCLVQFTNPKTGFNSNNITSNSGDFFQTKESFASFDKL